MKSSETQSRLRASLIEEVSRQIVSDLEALQTVLPGTPRQQVSIQGPSDPGANAEPFSLEGPRTVLEGGARYVAPYLPAGTRFRAAKALLLRSLRIVTRDQSVFNSALTEALRIALKEIEEGVVRSREREASDAAQLKQLIDGRTHESNQRLDQSAESVQELRALVEAISKALESAETRMAAVEAGTRDGERARTELQARIEEQDAHQEEARDQLARDVHGALSRIEQALEKEGAARNALGQDVERRFLHQEAMRTALATEFAAVFDREAKARHALATDMDRRVEHQEKMRGALSAELNEALRAEERARELIGAELTRSLTRLDRAEREGDRQADLVKALRWETEGSAGKLALLARRLDAMSEEVRLSRLEWTALRSSLRTSAPVPVTGDVRPSSPPARHDSLDAGTYAGFEERFRGREDVIRQRQMKDARRFVGSPGLVVDLGCGRGEFLEALRELGVPAEGCDTNAVAVARAREKGLAIAEADLFAWLERQPDASLGGITAFQVVEHLESTSLIRLVELAAIKLAPKGKVLFETVNPESVFAMKWFWMDLTHVRPVPGGSLEQLLLAAGFRNVTLDYRSPVPPESAPPPDVFADPRLAQMAELLFGAQDVAAIGER